jgi:hypothetical protein
MVGRKSRVVFPFEKGAGGADGFEGGVALAPDLQ